MTKKKLKAVSIICMIISIVLWIAISYLLMPINTKLVGVYFGEVFEIFFVGVPTAFLQFRLCLTDKEKWVRWVPAAVILVGYMISALEYLFDIEIVSLLGLVIAILFITPAAGVCIGWLAYGKKLAFIPLNIMMIFYLIMNRIPFISRPPEIADLFATLYIFSGVYFFLKPIKWGIENEDE